ncbi:hypothetical protein EYC08_17765 [Tabrizicola sp. WMC-M-20]|nr:hypothetical protein EYC08_17765 [Tabrizicola sp. WMC-M-20]
MIILFVVLFALPLEPVLGGLTLSGTRLYAMLVIIPFFFAVLSGAAGRVTVTDGLMLAFASWMFMTFLMHHGTERFPYAAITFAELMGGYLAGRLLVCSAIGYRFFFQAFFVMLLVLLPFATYEMMTGRAMLSDLLAQIARVTPRSTEVREGYFRAGVSYPHPILWGVIAAMLLAQAWILWADQTLGRWMRTGVAVACTLTAMSSAPLLGLAIQIAIILWGRLTGNRWWLLTILFGTTYVALDILSNRGPVILMIETLTLNPQTAWWRVHIWNFGSVSVMNNPWIGIGLNDWVRPEWLAATVDNFWLLIAMRHGLPAILFLGFALVLHLWQIIRMRDLSEADTRVRVAYVIGLLALSFMLSTVHAWGAPSVLVMFYFGIGTYLYTGGAVREGDQQISSMDSNSGNTAAMPRAELPYSRFPHHPSRRTSTRHAADDKAPLGGSGAGRPLRTPAPPAPRANRTSRT